MDGTRKWMLRMDEVQGIETVYIPEPDRGTLCISSQVGCAMDCTFCATAQQGFNRNLTVAEIVGQVWLAHRESIGGGARRGPHITNIVFMGMGEPLANYRNVVPAMRIFIGRSGLRLVASARHVEHVGTRAADLQAGGGMQRGAGGVAARAQR